MTSVVSTGPRTYKSRIPVRVTKAKSTNMTCKENVCERKSTVLRTLNKNNCTEKKEPEKGQATKFKTCIHKPITAKNSKENKKKDPLVIKTTKCNENPESLNKLKSEGRKKSSLRVNAPTVGKQKTKGESCPGQEDIKFEANEFYRKMILSNKELSPSLCKTVPGVKLSSVLSQRPSAYKELILHPRPHEVAMQAIANASAKRANRKCSTFKEKKEAPTSPLKDRRSFYTPCPNPELEVMRKLEALKLRKLQSSTKKKVTFNLLLQEYTAKVDFDTQDICNVPERLTEISEKSEENTPCSPSTPTKSTELKPECNNLPAFQIPSIQIEAAYQMDDRKDHHLLNNEVPEINTLPKKYTFTPQGVLTKKVSHLENVQPSLFFSNKTNSLDLHSDPTYCDQDITERNELNLNANRTSQVKIYTPRPVSFDSNSRLLNTHLSPEFLMNKTSCKISKLAPIYTPLVLKNIAKSSSSPDNLSPVRLKLDFNIMGKETPPKEVLKTRASISYERFLTVQKKLDELADQECYLSLLNENTVPVICGRYLTNPVAVTLSEGDEMHFVPVGF